MIGKMEARCVSYNVGTAFRNVIYTKFRPEGAIWRLSDSFGLYGS